MRESSYTDVSEILDTFNLTEISQIIDNQINSPEGEIYIGSEMMADNFKPLYSVYKQILAEKDDLSFAIVEETRSRFTEICLLFINKITTKFNLHVSENWLDENPGKIAALTIALYNTFVMNFTGNVSGVLLRYIYENRTIIFNMFEEMKNKKDSSTMVNKKMLPPDLCVITSNIYDISTWIMEQLTESDFLNLMPQSDEKILIKELFESGVIGGEFVEVIDQILRERIEFKSSICFDLTSKIKTDFVSET